MRTDKNYSRRVDSCFSRNELLADLVAPGDDQTEESDWLEIQDQPQEIKQPEI